MFDFKGKTVLVTGAARGIGKNIAVKFAESGAKVIMIDIGSILLDETCRDLRKKGLDVNSVEFDLSRIDFLEDFIKDMNNTFGSIDILINNARAGKRTLPLSETVSNFDLIADVSLKAPLFLSQAFINASTGTKNANENRSIINISSVVARNICKESTGYHITKAAIENLTRYLAVHGGPYGFRVNAIRPGFIVQDEHQERYESDGNQDFRKVTRFCHPTKRIGKSEDVSNAALFLCSDLAAFITGQVLTVDGGLTIQDQWDLVYTFHQNQEK